MSRSFYIGEEVRQEEIKAAFDSGVLKITVPKVQETAKLPENNYIEIE